MNKKTTENHSSPDTVTPNTEARQHPDQVRRQLLYGAGVGSGLLALAGLGATTGFAGGRTTPGAGSAQQEMTEGLVPPTAPETRRAAAELQAVLREFDALYLNAERGITTARDIIDGHRFLMHLLSAGTEMYMEGDPERPWFARMVSPARKFLGDNPDAFYYSALIRSDRYYRITGRRKGNEYISFTVHGGDHEGNWNAPATAHINHRDILFNRDGSYELMMGPKPRGKNWLLTRPGSIQVVNRHYYELPQSAAANSTIHPELWIEAVDPAPVPATLPDDMEMARRLRAVTRFIRITSLDMPLPNPEQIPKWWSLVPNEMGIPMNFGKNQEDIGLGAMDNTYVAGSYALPPDQALLLEGELPGCFFANVVLWNRYLQTDNYLQRRVSLNRQQMETVNGRYRIVVSARDPGVRNWLDTGGRTTGTIQWRFLLAEGEVQRPRTRLVDMEEARRPL